MDKDDLKKVKQIVEDLLRRMAIGDFTIRKTAVLPFGGDHRRKSSETSDKMIVEKDGELVGVDIDMPEPRFIIGQSGQTLFELQRILRILVNKKVKKNIHLSLDINDYKKRKIDYLKNLAKSIADEVELMREEKILPAMSAYERRLIHVELEGRNNIITESRGEGDNRRIVVRPL